jgi:hypothetical protein
MAKRADIYLFGELLGGRGSDSDSEEESETEGRDKEKGAGKNWRSFEAAARTRPGARYDGVGCVAQPQAATGRNPVPPQK